MTKRTDGRRKLNLETMESRVVLTANSLVSLAAPPAAIVEVNIEQVSTVDVTNTGNSIATDPADLNNDGKVSAADIDVLSMAIRDGLIESQYDLNGDKMIDKADMDVLIHEHMNTEYGDADLNGTVDFLDFMAWRNNAFSSGTWESGDFTGDGLVDGQDFLRWNSAKGYVRPLEIVATDITVSDSNLADEVQTETVETETEQLKTPVQETQAARTQASSHAESTTRDLEETSDEQPRRNELLGLK